MVLLTTTRLCLLKQEGNVGQTNRFSYRTNKSVVIKVDDMKVFEVPAGTHLQIIVKRAAARLSKQALWKILDTPTVELDLPVHARNALVDHSQVSEEKRRSLPEYYKPTKYVGDLIQLNESHLLKIKNFGRKSLKDVKGLLEGLGVPLGTPVGDWVPPDQRGQ